jgi:hypothetical protein
MSGHPGAMGVMTDPPAGAGAGPRELGPGLDRAARGTDEPNGSGSMCGVSRCQ